MTTDFWNRVLAEYDANNNINVWTICHRSETFYEAYECQRDHAAIQKLAEQFLSDTDAGSLFTNGNSYLFRLRPEYFYGDVENNLRRRAVRRDFLLWARDNDTDTTNNPTTP